MRSRGQEAESLLQLNLHQTMVRCLPLRAVKDQSVVAKAIFPSSLYFACLRRKVADYKEFSRKLGPWTAMDFDEDEAEFGNRVLLHLTGQEKLPARVSREGARIVWGRVTQLAFCGERKTVRVRGVVRLA